MRPSTLKPRESGAFFWDSPAGRSFSRAALCLLAAGCASAYPVRFNGYSRQAGFPCGKTFFVSRNANTGNALLDGEIGDKINALLKARGYRAADRAQAEYIVTYGYALTGQDPSDIKPGYSVSVGAGTGFTRGSSVSTSLVFPGSARRATSYTYTLTVSVYAAQPYRADEYPAPLWTGEATTTTDEPDIRGAVDALLVPMASHFGEDTRKPLRIDVHRPAGR